MKVGLEISYRDVEKSDAIETLIHEKVAKLEKLCDYISSCHIAVEKIHDRPSHGSPYRVRIDMTVPPGHELVWELEYSFTYIQGIKNYTTISIIYENTACASLGCGMWVRRFP
jgi:hypothetical protein